MPDHRIYSITGSRFAGATGTNRAVLYTASECAGCFDRTAMAGTLRALAVGKSATFPALRFVDGPADPPPVVITRES